MRRAGEQALDALESLLEQVRKQKSLSERKRGIFYSGSTPFLHFHEDPAGLFADLKVRDQWTRLRVSTKSEQRAFLSKLAAMAVKM